MTIDSMAVRRSARLRRGASLVIAAACLCGAAGCIPRVPPLSGALVTTALPDTRARSPRRVTFTWKYEDDNYRAGGEGVATVASADSATVDLFILPAGFPLGAVSIVGDAVIAPGLEAATRLLPPPAFFWAALGTVRVSGSDTVRRVDGDTLAAEIGPEPRWRVRYVGARVARLERIVKSRVTEWLARETNDRIHYQHVNDHRTLEITIAQSPDAEPHATTRR